MTHVGMLPTKVLFIMLPWGHAEMMICFSCIMGDVIEFIHGHLVLGGGQFGTFFILPQHKGEHMDDPCGGVTNQSTPHHAAMGPYRDNDML